MAERHNSPDYKAFRAAITKSAQEPDLSCKLLEQADLRRWKCLATP
jgi:hypothetical protein